MNHEDKTMMIIKYMKSKYLHFVAYYIQIKMMPLCRYISKFSCIYAYNTRSGQEEKR